jgi:hypothetical protein
MTLQYQLEQQLASLGGGPARVCVESPPRTLVCDLADHNSLAVSLNQLQLRTSELANASTVELKRISESLAARLTYLLEPISPIEIDTTGCVVQLRSSPPQCDDDGLAYYELLVRRGGEITLARFRKDSGAERQRIPATITREALLRLAADMNATIDQKS